MLKFNDNWELFSNHGEFDNSHANSLEGVHDDIHGFVGRGETRGHMNHAFFAGKHILCRSQCLFRIDPDKCKC